MLEKNGGSRSDSAMKASAGPPRPCFAAVAPGLEPALVDELTELGLEVRSEPGGASFVAAADGWMRVCAKSRIAGRLTVGVGSARATSLDELARGVRAMPWKDFVIPGQTVEVRASVKGSRLNFADTVAKKVEISVVDALRGPRRAGARPPREPAHLLIRVEGDRAHLSMDAAGELLHRRGWRLATAKAPLRENLAAAMLRIAGYDAEEPLVDPMCGAGTFVIEAAGIALGHAPGAKRSFDFLRWPCIDARAFAGQAANDSLKGRAPIWGFDRDAGAIEASVQNSKRAGVAERVKFAQVDFLRLDPPASSGLLVANPPYGSRVGTGEEIRDFYRRMGRVLLERWRGWRIALLLPDGPLGAAFGLPMERVTGFSNGGLRVGVWCGDL